MLTRLFKGKKLDPEAFYAYYNRLPDTIEVKWKKSKGIIVGIVKADNFTFGVQEKTPDKFVDVVNEGVLVAYDTPNDYLGLLLKHRKFNPPPKDWDDLRNVVKKRSTMSLDLDKKADELVTVTT